MDIILKNLNHNNDMILTNLDNCFKKSIKIEIDKIIYIF